jgi:hypothetical protein
MKNMTDNRELLSALIDGEAVDADTVADALEIAANRRLLVDFLRLRGSVQAEDDAPAKWRPDRLMSAGVPRAERRRAWMRIAAMLALLTAGGLGATWVEGLLTREGPPEPTRVVQLQVVDRQ